MSLKKKDLQTYRRDEQFGHRLMTPEERIRLLKPYLPSPPPSLNDSNKKLLPKSAETTQAREGRFGVRRFLKKNFYLLVFTAIHFFFSIYIRARQACHAVSDRVYSLFQHHHSSPELIERDVKGLKRLPKHLGVILTLEDQGRSGDALEKLLNEAGEIAAWCASAGIPELSIYEKTGILKGYIPEVHRALSTNLQRYFGSNYPILSVAAPHIPPVETAIPRHRMSDKSSLKRLSVLLISAEDGRDSIVDLTKTLAEMSQRKKIDDTDITTELIDAELSESVMGEPDLLILFGPHVELAGYPPWQIRLTEIFHVQDNQGVGYQVFKRGLYNYARANFRMGR
ncbi:Decaprenyl diphosphate synthase-like protein [Podospora fimiseda]|uniref:ditrans,polycis-polyprenyl diphosphate synthase [(2E,6E)-farnesyldiphosphate specific] n=1 Tax=Podospora fimiseda TaxID=252190 RepID=A0AAN7H0L3_9PEZI|nr:Decaprenyl diphosphate synthase-like protein [Podospora fimiseda]